MELGLVQKGHSRQKQCTHRPGVQETMLVGDVGDALYLRELVSSQRRLKPLSLRGPGCQHGELHPTQSVRRRCYAQAPSHHLSPTSHQSPSPVFICLLNTSPCCPSSSPPTDPPPSRSWASASPWDCAIASVGGLPPTPAPCAAARVDL